MRKRKAAESCFSAESASTVEASSSVIIGPGSDCHFNSPSLNCSTCHRSKRNSVTRPALQWARQGAVHFRPARPSCQSAQQTSTHRLRICDASTTNSTWNANCALTSMESVTFSKYRPKMLPCVGIVIARKPEPSPTPPGTRTSAVQVP